MVTTSSEYTNLFIVLASRCETYFASPPNVNPQNVS
jgi:hypothetical protein